MLRLFFGLPPVGYFVIAALLAGAGFYLDNDAKASDAERALALQGEMPELVDLGAYIRSDTELANEVHIAAQFNQEHVYTLHKDSDNDPSARVLYMLFDPTETAQDRSVKAAIVVPLRDDEALYQWMSSNLQGDAEMSPIFHFNGTRSGSVSYSDIAKDAIRDNGFTTAPGFFFLQPFINGREAGLAPKDSTTSFLMIGLVAGLLVALIGLAKLVMRRRRAG